MTTNSDSHEQEKPVGWRERYIVRLPDGAYRVQVWCAGTSKARRTRTYAEALRARDELLALKAAHGGGVQPAPDGVDHDAEALRDTGLAAMREVIAGLGVEIETLPDLWTEIRREGRVIARYRTPEQLVGQLLGERAILNIDGEEDEDVPHDGNGADMRGIQVKDNRFEVKMYVPATKRSMYIGLFHALDEALAARDRALAATSVEEVEALRDSFKRYRRDKSRQAGAFPGLAPAQEGRLADLMEALRLASERLADAEAWHAESSEALQRARSEAREAAQRLRNALVEAYPSFVLAEEGA